MSDSAKIVKLVVHEGATPRHVQIHVGPHQVAVDYIDSEGNVAYTTVTDRNSVDVIAEREGIETVERHSEGSPERDLAGEAVARTRAEALGEPVPPEDDAPVTEPEAEEVTVKELQAEAKALGIKGRSKMDKETLIAAIAEAKA